jgi:fructuronate reductase
VVGINIRPPSLRIRWRGGLYTRLIREDQRIEARVIASIVKVVDSPAPALDVLSRPTSNGDDDGDRERLLSRPSAANSIFTSPTCPDSPTRRRGQPGILARALELRWPHGGR